MSANDANSKKVVEYSKKENQFAIEYTAIFDDGTSDYFIESKVDKTAEKLPIWIEYIKKDEESKKETSNNS